jgi:hypothetical protein
MLDFLGEADAASRITKACDSAGDIIGSTSEDCDLVAERV